MTLREQDFIHEDAPPPVVYQETSVTTNGHSEVLDDGLELGNVSKHGEDLVLPVPVPVEEQAVTIEDPPPRVRPFSLSVREGDSEAVRKWKSSPFAVGLVRATWQEEFQSKHGGRSSSNNNNRNPQGDDGDNDEDDDDDNLGSRLLHLQISGLCCGSFLKMERLGNMTILWKTTPRTTTTDDGNNKPRIRLMTGPFWFVTAFVTLPIILAISFVIYLRYIVSCYPFWVSIIWGVCLAFCLFSLLRASTMDPGIQYRYIESPQEGWIWNDQAKTYRSPTAKYVSSCAVVVEGYDHVCPWVGTAIGANNMPWFRRFVWMIGICLLLDVLLIMMYAHGGISSVTVGCSGV